MAKKPSKTAGNQRIARRLAGVGPKAKLPAKGTMERRTYDSAMRALQRSQAAGKVNPKTGKPLQARPSTRVVTAGERIAAEQRALRKKTVTLRNVTVLTIVNDGRSAGRRVRNIGDVTMTRAQYRYLKKLDQDQDDEGLGELFANVSARIADIAAAPSVYSLDIADVRFSGID